MHNSNTGSGASNCFITHVHEHNHKTLLKLFLKQLQTKYLMNGYQMQMSTQNTLAQVQPPLSHNLPQMGCSQPEP